MVYMGGKGRNNASRSNQTSHYGIMGGLVPLTNIAQGVKRFRLRRGRIRQTIPLMPVPGLQYMRAHDILSKNPAGSGGVGHNSVLVGRELGPCNCSVSSGGGEIAEATSQLLRPRPPPYDLCWSNEDKAVCEGECSGFGCYKRPGSNEWCCPKYSSSDQTTCYEKCSVHNCKLQGDLWCCQNP